MNSTHTVNIENSFHNNVVHGFLKVMYDVAENDSLDIIFQHNVKGETKLPNLDIPGIITAAPGGSASKSSTDIKFPCYFINALLGVSDYDVITPINASNNTLIHFIIIDDDIPLEDDESVILTFIPNDDFAREFLEAAGEFIRNSVTVNIIDNDSKSFCIGTRSVFVSFSVCVHLFSSQL